MAPSTPHIRPTTELAPRALLPGDPGRSLLLATELLDEPLMFNHHRGLWGYTGMASDGRPLTIQSTGMGGPSAALVLHELALHGLERAVRVGTCGALVDELELGDLLVVSDAIAADGTSAALGAGPRAAPDPGLRSALERSCATPARTVVSTDLFYEPEGGREQAWVSQGAWAVEMEAAALFAEGHRSGVAVACLLAVSDLLAGGRTRIADERLAEASAAMGRFALEALSA